MTRRAPRPRRGGVASAWEGLSLLRSELNREVVSAFAARGPMTKGDLRAWLVVGSTSTVGKCVDALLGAGLLRVRRGRVHEFALTTAGHELADLVELAGAWLASHPRRELAGTALGWRAFGAAADAWQAGVLGRILRAPANSEELAREIKVVSVRRLKADLATLVGAGLLDLRRTRGGVRRYRITGWGRHFVGLIVAIAHWERSCLADRAAPFGIDDAMLALVAALPLLRLPDALAGHCTLTVEVDRGAEAAPRAGALWVSVAGGQVVDWGEGAAPRPPAAWASGPVDAWLAALRDGRSDALRGGSTEDASRLPGSLIEQLHSGLLGYQKN